jgi:hypothetical protein
MDHTVHAEHDCTLENKFLANGLTEVRNEQLRWQGEHDGELGRKAKFSAALSNHAAGSFNVVSLEVAHFDVAPVTTALLDKERKKRGGDWPEPFDDELVAQKQPGDKDRRGAGRRRRVKAGHYPVGFSPYLMGNRRGRHITSLGRFDIKNDLQVLAYINVCTGIWFRCYVYCQYCLK